MKAVTTGFNTWISPKASVGAPGFVFAQSKTGWYYKQLAQKPIIIGDDCFISDFVTVCYGKKGSTVIADNTIIDAHAHISHDVILGRHVQIGTRVTLLGHVTVGDYTKIFAGAVINPRVKIGKNCIIGAASYVRQDVPDGCVSYGNPARIIDDPIKYPTRVF